jgi:predicted dehydrogenase
MLYSMSTTDPRLAQNPAQSPARFAVIGTGWRAQYFLRLAGLLPDRFEVVGVVGRSRESAERVGGRWNARPFTSLTEMVAAGRPEFVVTALPWGVAPGVAEAVVEIGLPVLSETPPAPDLDGLRALWRSVGASGLVQVAEQYHLMPSHASRLALARSGAIGTVTSCQISSTHGYHAVALMRAYLGAGFGPATVNAHNFVAPLINPLVRDAWTDDDQPKDATTTIASIDFGGSMGLYDFTDNQWHNQLRSRRILIRGSAGEIEDDEVVRLVGPRTIVRSPLVRRQTGYDLNLDAFDTDHISLGDTILYRNPFPGLRFNDEDIAISSILARMAAWCRKGGGAPYPLADACQDHLVSIAIDRSASSGAPVTTSVEAWAPSGK